MPERTSNSAAALSVGVVVALSLSKLRSGGGGAAGARRKDEAMVRTRSNDAHGTVASAFPIPPSSAASQCAAITLNGAAGWPPVGFTNATCNYSTSIDWHSPQSNLLAGTLEPILSSTAKWVYNAASVSLPQIITPVSFIPAALPSNKLECTNVEYDSDHAPINDSHHQFSCATPITAWTGSSIEHDLDPEGEGFAIQASFFREPSLGFYTPFPIPSTPLEAVDRYPTQLTSFGGIFPSNTTEVAPPLASVAPKLPFEWMGLLDGGLDENGFAWPTGGNSTVPISLNPFSTEDVNYRWFFQQNLQEARCTYADSSGE
ncbi:hypothetical protein BKA70DRAFT_1492261 [Coprinopsis sp. MPI-PUGE-AT-0042]|nr:hypothetical protein BKA70DRAFT_1492261 [Coprinopsis sp. MPI-PUGE-AT-0042]